MKTVNIADLKNRLSSYLQLVREGEEIIVKDRNHPIARITPYDTSGLSESERRLVASGALKLPEEQTTNWDEFLDESSAGLGRRLARTGSCKRSLRNVRKAGNGSCLPGHECFGPGHLGQDRRKVILRARLQPAGTLTNRNTPNLAPKSLATRCSIGRHQLFNGEDSQWNNVRRVVRRCSGRRPSVRSAAPRSGKAPQRLRELLPLTLLLWPRPLLRRRERIRRHASLLHPGRRRILPATKAASLPAC